MEKKRRKRHWAGVRAGTERARSLLGPGSRGRRPRRVGSPMTSPGSRPRRAAFLAVILLLLQVKGAKTQKGSPGPEERSLGEKTPPAGRWGGGGRSVPGQAPGSWSARASLRRVWGMETAPGPVIIE